MAEQSIAGDALQAINHFSLTVSDLERSVAFYREKLGFEVVVRQEGDTNYLSPITGYPNVGIRMAQMQMPSGIRLELFQYTNPVGKPHDPETYHPLSTHICFNVTDLGSLYERLQAAGVEFRSEPVVVSSGANKGGLCCYLRDPDGFSIELFQVPVRPA